MIFSSYAGDEFKVGDEEYLLLRESDILATYLIAIAVARCRQAFQSRRL